MHHVKVGSEEILFEVISHELDDGFCGGAIEVAEETFGHDESGDIWVYSKFSHLVSQRLKLSEVTREDGILGSVQGVSVSLNSRDSFSKDWLLELLILRDDVQFLRSDVLKVKLKVMNSTEGRQRL
jgi:hypothetical protein